MRRRGCRARVRVRVRVRCMARRWMGREGGRADERKKRWRGKGRKRGTGRGREGRSVGAGGGARRGREGSARDGLETEGNRGRSGRESLNLYLSDIIML